MRILRLALIVLAGTVLTCCYSSKVSVDGLKKDIDRECPAGSHYSNVLALLDKKGINHSAYKEGKLYDLSIEDYVKVRTIGAQLPRVRRSLFTTWTIYMSFEFDQNGRLSDYKVRESPDEDS